MSTANRVLKNTGFLYGKMAITVFISLYTTRLILNALGVSDFGIYNVVGGAIAMLGFLHASMASATQRFMSFYEGKGDKEKQKYIFNVSTILHYGIAVVLILILLIAGFIFFNGVLNIPPDRVYAAKVIYGSVLVSTLFTVVSVPYEAVLNAHENMFYYSVVGIFESLLKLGVAFAVISYGGDKLVFYGILMAIVPFISRLIMQVYCYRKYEECVIKFRKYWDRDMMKEMTSFAGWSFFGTSVSMVTNYGQGIVINYFFSTAVNAAQGVANQILGQLDAFSLNLLKALNPVIVKREGEGNRSAMIEASITGSKLSFALFAFFSVPALIEMNYFLKLWLHTVPEYAVIFCQLLLIRALITRMTSGFTTAISATGKIKEFQVTSSLLTLIPLSASCVFFYFGYEPWVLYIIYIVHVTIRSFGIILYYVKKLCGLNVKSFMLNVVSKCFGVTIFSYFLASIPNYFLETGILRLVIVIIVSVVTFSSLFFYVCLNAKERGVIYKIINAIWSKITRK